MTVDNPFLKISGHECPESASLVGQGSKSLRQFSTTGNLLTDLVGELPNLVCPGAATFGS
jgi:hypothetical protein